MPKFLNQKLKLMYLYRILSEKTDETHIITMSQIIDELALYGIRAERKSLYNDIESLRLFGLEVERKGHRGGGYYLASKPFELHELKLLADAVACSKFITERKSEELIGKIARLASKHEASQLKRHVFISNRVKAGNEKIYYNVDEINRAIDDGRKITFDYFDIGPDKCRHYSETRGTVSPYVFAWDDDKYYMIGYHETRRSVTQFRLDRMENIIIMEEPIVPPPADFDPSRYFREFFFMFGGEEKLVRLRFENGLSAAVFDKFGIDIPVFSCGGGYFETCVHVAVSGAFFGWLFQFNGGAEIVAPDGVKEQYRCMAETAFRANSEMVGV